MDQQTKLPHRYVNYLAANYALLFLETTIYCRRTWSGRIASLMILAVIVL